MGTGAQLRRLAAVAAATLSLAVAGLAALPSESRNDAPDAAAARVIAAAKTHLGEAYQWGGTGPRSWDCSGLTSIMWREFGGVDDIPRVSQAQAAWAIPIAAEDARPGDLVFFDQPVTHVSLYLGRGQVIDASSARGAVVIRDVWTSGEVTYGRVPRPTAPPARVVRASRALKPTLGRAPALIKADGKMNAVPKLGAVSRRAPSPGASRFVSAARRAVGAKYAARGRGPTYDAGGLVAMSWRRAGGGVLPTTAAALELRTTRVRVRDVAPGDLVFYGSPAVHVGVYVGGGRMVDSSRVLHRVVLRPVFASDTVRFARIARGVRKTVKKAVKKAAAKPAKKAVRKPAKKSVGSTVKRPASPPPRKVAGAKPAPKQPARRQAPKPARQTRGR